MRLYVGNLAWSAVEEDLLDLFKDYGCREAKVIRDHDSGKSRGYGFVEVECGEEATRDLHHTLFSGRTINVQSANKGR